jgi:DNA-binding MarR family transcriptional regulator
MIKQPPPGLGELLRYVGELVDQSAEAQYQAMQLVYRPRYTPVLRALATGAQTISDITASSHLTQGAISQSVALMITDGLIVKHSLEDGRKSGIRLTSAGKKLLATLEPHWQATFTAIAQLEKDIGYPLLAALEATANALHTKDFATRIHEVKASKRGKS